MRIGTIHSLPDSYTQWAKIKDEESGVNYTVSPKHLKDGADVGDSYAYKVELFDNDGGLVYFAEED